MMQFMDIASFENKIPFPKKNSMKMRKISFKIFIFFLMLNTFPTPNFFIDFESIVSSNWLIHCYRNTQRTQ